MKHMRMRPALLGACVLSACAAVAAQDAPSPSPFGFMPADGAAQLKLEQRFDAALDPADQRAWMKEMSSLPNQVGTPKDKANAEFMLAKFRAWGWDAHIEVFHVLDPTPKKIGLELLGPKPYVAKLHEPPVPGDATSTIQKDVLPPYNAYGGDGDVTAELVYVNYGMADDYAELARHGVDVRGKIVIARYGEGWRGLKPKLAQEHGAVGCIIYSDPAANGYARGDTYPVGGWRPAEGVQRGSVMDMLTYPGDPLTPNVGATADARRLPLKDAVTVMKIPSLPISWSDAQPLLAAIGGPVAPQRWRGALGVTYHLGPSTAKVHLTVESNWIQQPLYDVIATLKGSSEPDQWVIRANHHDGWVFGAFDPLAGNVAMMAEAKAIGALVKQGWRPKRTLVYASWDGEEPMLLGSTEWVETHAKELKQKAVLYVNSDTSGRGFLFAGGTHSVQHLLNQVTAGVADPETHASVQDRLRARILVGSGYQGSADAKAAQQAAASGKDLPIGPLGSGSDYSAFVDHLGIATLDLGFGGESPDRGVYHSRYDSFDHFVKFSDSTFAYGVALAKIAGHVVLRTADADILPMRFTDFSDTLGRYVGQLHQLVDQTRKDTERQHRLLAMNAYALASDPQSPVAPPVRDSDVPAIDLAPLDASAKALEQSAQAWQAAYMRFMGAGKSLSAKRAREVNALAGSMEQTLTDPAGLPDRPWYKNLIYAPGMLTGYGAKTVPGVREALEGRRWDEANRYARVTAQALDRYRAQLDRLTSALTVAR